MRGMHNRKAFKKVLPLFLASSMVLSNISVFATENTNGESNLALNKTTFSSGDETEGFNSTKVTDGIINRNANNGEQSRWASVRYAENPYVGVDLGEKTVFNEVVIEWERKNINSYEIQISDDKDSWTTIYTGTTVNNYRDVISLGNQEARYVRAVVKEYDPAEEGSTISWETVSVYELEVYNRDSVVRPEAGVNIALNKTATASSQEGGTSFSAAKAFDGTIDRTSTKQSRWASAVSSEDQWLKVDLGEVTEFDNIVIEWERRNAPKYRIQVSDDDVTWNDVYTATAAPANFKDIISLNEKVRGRYVRLYIDEHLANSEGVNWNTVSVYELELYNGEIPEAPKTAAEVAASLKVTAPTEDATVLKMPSVPEGFEISFIGADYEEVIDYDMNIHKPLVDTKVVVNFEVKKGDEKATSPAFEIIVPGQYEVEGNVKPTVIPELREWAGKTGNFEISNNSRIVLNPTSAEELRETAETFANDYKDIVGNDIEVVVSDAPQAGDFYLSLTSNYPELREEGYYMDIDDVLSVEGNDASAIFLSTRSILQILKQNGTFIEKGLVRDYPQYDVRGFMLDVGRKPISLDFLYEVMQNMSWYKLNDFQIHLNDNYIWLHDDYPTDALENAYSGFRLESNDVGENGLRLTSEDMYYTKEEFGNFIDDAKLYGVNIVPEIDSPGHSLAFTKVHPEYAYGNGQGENAAMLNVNDEKVVDYIKSIFSEYMDGENPVFRNSTVHIGTDEFYGGKEEYRAYTDKMLRFIKEEKGSNVRVWGSLSNKNGSTPVYSDGVEMNIWNSGWANAQAMYDQGYDLINTEDSYLYLVPGANYYYNYLNHSWLYNNWEVNTFSNGVTIPEGSPQMNGGMFALWNDMIDNKANGIVEYDIFDRILPGMQVLSEKMWGEADDKTYNEFVEVADEVGVAPNTNPRFEVESTTEKVMEYDFNKFENNTVEDKSENGYDSTEINNASVNDGVLELAGGNSYIKTGINNMGPNYSVSFSVKRDENSDDSEQILFESSKGTFKAVQAGTGKLGFSREGYDYSFDYELPKGEWVDITVVGKLNKTEIYVNGEYVEQILEEGSNIKYTTFVFPLEKIGSESKAFKGQVDNLVITNEAVITDETVIDSTNFTVTSDNENALVNGVEGPAYLAFDNDLNTIWHSNYSPYQALP
ncbi:discoidin domain-containing protein, partial [Clostridium celatum]